MTVTSERHTQKYRAIDEEKDYRPKRLFGARNERDDGLLLNRFSTERDVGLRDGGFY